MKFTLAAVSLFGLEGITADECKRLGFENVRADTGKVFFDGDFSTIAKANLWLRTAERILIYVGGGHVTTFTELFDLTAALPWETIIPESGEFPVKGHTLGSTLHSLPDCQAIIKKAIVKRMQSVYHREWLPEDGERYQVQFSLMKDEYAVYIDTSGEGLHKRGYRANAGIAPLRETLAAGILLISRYRGYESLYDPMCGSGTFLIEAALIATNRAPGLQRSFSAEKWRIMPEDVFPTERKAALAAIRNLPCHIAGSDIDPEVVALTLENAKKAGVGSLVEATCLAAASVNATPDVLICNPPYGERMADKSQAAAAARTLAQIRAGRSYIITSDERFEEFYKRKATKKRKLYNGMIKCQLYMYLPREKASGKPVSPARY